MAIVKRKITKETFEKAREYLRHSARKSDGCDMEAYFHNIEVKDGANEGLVMDALIGIADDKISLHKIWEMEFDDEKGMWMAKNLYGETGKRARLLSEKYLDQFFRYLESVDLKDNNDRTYELTPQMVAEIEDKIDQEIQQPISDSDIGKYERFELIEMGLSALRYFFNELGWNGCVTSYNKLSSEFETVFCEGGGISVSLSDVVKEKWKRGCELSRALIACAAKELKNRS